MAKKNEVSKPSKKSPVKESVRRIQTAPVRRIQTAEGWKRSRAKQRTLEKSEK